MKFKKFICDSCGYTEKSKIDIFYCPMCKDVNMGKYEDNELIEEVDYADGYYLLKVNENQMTLFLTVLDLALDVLKEKKNGV